MTRGMVLRVFRGCRLVSCVVYRGDTIHDSLRLARAARENFKAHIRCDDTTNVWCEIGFERIS
jgi:hypothetical protein